MEKPSDFYVYIIYRKNGEPCYVGKGRGRRIAHHKRHTHNKHLKNIFNQPNEKPLIVKVLSDTTEETAFAFEKDLIRLIGRKDLKTGPLVNHTNGGEGSHGLLQSQQKRDKLSAALKGRIFTEEHLKNMSLSKIGKKRSPESCAKQSATITGRKKPGVSAKLKGRKCPWVTERQLGSKNPEHAQKMLGNKNSLGKNLGKENQKPRKLTEDIVREIRARVISGETHQSIASDYGIHKSQISLIHLRKTWAWVD